MATHRTQPPELTQRSLSPLTAGLLIGGVIFLMLPISQMLSLGLRDSERSADISIIEPPDLFETPPPPEEEIQEEEIEELERDQEPPTLEQLELAMNPDVSGLSGGDFTVPTYDLSQEIGEMIYEMRDLTTHPQAIAQPAPIYPPELKRAGIEGEVYVEFLIRQDGSAERPRILESTNPAFEEPVIRAVRRWRFRPGERAGQPVTVRVRQRIPFSLN